MIEDRQSRIQSLAFVIAVSAAICFSMGFAVSTLLGFEQSCGVELDVRINPNDGPVASLARLPGIGIVRAGAIAAYRENFTERQGGRPAFQNCDDLQKVKGVGPKTIQNVSNWLKFE